MTPDEIKRLRELCESATENLGNEDYDFYCAAREALPKLLDEVDGKSRVIENISEALFSANKQCDVLKAEVERLNKDKEWVSEMLRNAADKYETLLQERANLKAEVKRLNELRANDYKNGYEQFHAMEEERDRALARIGKLRECLKELGDRMPRCECVDAHGWANQALAQDDNGTSREIEIRELNPEVCKDLRQYENEIIGKFKNAHKDDKESPKNQCGLCTDDKPCNFETCPNTYEEAGE